MSRFSGPQRRGAMKQVRETKRKEAQERDAALPADSPRRRKNRTPAAKLLTEIFGSAYFRERIRRGEVNGRSSQHLSGGYQR